MNAETIGLIGLIIAGITVVGLFAEPQLTAWRQRRNEEKDKNLRKHFDDLRKEAREVIDLASSFTETPSLAGGIGIYVAGLEGSGEYVPVKEDDEPQLSDSLRAHFPEQVAKWKEYRGRIAIHNKKCEQFRQGIKRAFELKGFPVKPESPEAASYIYDYAFGTFFTMWKQLAEGRQPLPDFRQIEQIESSSVPPAGEESCYILYPLGYRRGTSLACAKDQDDVGKLKSVLAEVAGNKEYPEEVKRRFCSADKLVGEVKDFGKQWDNELGDIDNFWPNKKRFQRCDGCPDCKKYI